MEQQRKHWGVNQWAAYFETRQLPVMQRSKEQVQQLIEQQGDELAPHDLALLVLDDPLLCLQLLREAERIRSQRLGNETTTPLQAVLQLGMDKVCKLLLDSATAEAGTGGFSYVEARSALAARMTLRWAPGRADMNATELALAALLADTGELLLWLYAPELAQAALDELHSGRASRSAQAQGQVCGFTFKELTLRCAETWNLPQLLQRLLRGEASERAMLTRICNDFARHVMNPDAGSDLALADDLVHARKLMPNISLEWLLDKVSELGLLRKQQLLQLAAQQEASGTP